MFELISFRGQDIPYTSEWQDNDTYLFRFGDGEFMDSEGDDYYLRFEYHVSDEEWIIEIQWVDDNMDISELDQFDSDKYITKEEIEGVKNFIRQINPALFFAN